ncbi:hypothetical protein [Vibrio phage vB_VaM_H2]|nr:hypothetical protein [Vibrio phage vB_VaM_H2]
MHYYKFNVASWAKDTGHLSLKEEGIYLRLVNYYYDTEKPIPLKTQLVLRKLRIADESELVNLILEEFFIKTKSGWTHKHCDKLISEYQKRAEANRKNAKLGGRPKNSDLYKPNGFSDKTESQPKGIPNQEPITNNDKLGTNNEEPPKKPSRFTPPTQEEVFLFMQEKGYPYQNEAMKFVNFYGSKGWMVGKNKMKNWKLAVNNWLSNCNLPKQQVQPEYNHEEARQREIEALRRNV